MDEEDMSRILSQLYQDNKELFDDWMESNYCCNCEFPGKKRW